MCHVHEDSSMQMPACLLDGVSLDDVCFSGNKEIDNAVRALYKRVLNGERGAQTEIDSHVYAELLFRERPESIIFNSGIGSGYIEQLRTCGCSGIHYHSLPDIGNYIRSVVFFSGDKPCASFDAEMPLIACIYDSLPNIKRTKQLKVKFEPLVGNGPQFSAIVSILLGTFLGLFPRAAKAPYFRKRCDIVSFLRKMQCLGEKEKVEALRGISNVIKLCFMEYVQFCIVEYMPVEKEVMMKGRTTNAFLNTLSGVCDIFRMQINDLEVFDLHNIDKIAVQCIERCYRLCKFKMQRHVPNRDFFPQCYKSVDWDVFSSALGIVEYCYFLNSHRICGKWGCNVFDHTRELRLMFPDTPEEVLKYACVLNQKVKTFKLPENITAKQVMSLRKQYDYCQDSREAISKFVVCLGCIVLGRGQKRVFRYSCRDGVVECVRCQESRSVFKIDLLGAILYLCGEVFIMCPMCLEILSLGMFDFGVARGCRNCCRSSGTMEPVPPKSRKKRKPCFHCFLPSSNILTLLDSKTMRIVDLQVCNKHMPQNHVKKYINEVGFLRVSHCLCVIFNISFFVVGVTIFCVVQYPVSYTCVRTFMSYIRMNLLDTQT